MDSPEPNPRFLSLAGPGPIALAAMFLRVHDDEDFYYVNDSSLVDLATALSTTSPPLISFNPGEHSAGRTLRGTVMLTDAGRDVLSQRRDRVESCGLDRWFGGVHLKSGSAIWRWDDQQERVTRS